MAYPPKLPTDRAAPPDEPDLAYRPVRYDYTGYPQNEGSTYYTERLAKVALSVILARILIAIAVPIIFFVGICIAGDDGQDAAETFVACVVIGLPCLFVLFVILHIASKAEKRKRIQRNYR